MYLRPFLRLVASGTLYGPDEHFSLSMSYVQAQPGFPGAAPTEVPSAVVAAFRTFWGGAPIAQGAWLEMLKLNRIGTDGKYTGDETVLVDLVPPAKGTATEAPAPQLAYAISLATGKTRGRAVHGRFYVPLPSTGVSAGGVIPDNYVQQWKAHGDTLLKALQVAVPGWVLGVVSDLGTGYENYVTHARYGRVIDTIRSRRNQLDEAHINGDSLSPA